MTLNRISSSCFYDKMQGNKEQQTSKLSTEQAFLNRYNSKDTGDVSDPVLEKLPAQTAFLHPFFYIAAANSLFRQR